MSKGKQRLPSSPVTATGWVVLALGLLVLLYGGARLIFVIGTNFVAEQATAGSSYTPACVAEITASSTSVIPAGCAMQFSGTIQFTNGTLQSYTTQAEFDATLAQLHAAQRLRSIVILASGAAVSALGLAIIAAGAEKPTPTRPTRARKRRSRQPRPKALANVQG